MCRISLVPELQEVANTLGLADLDGEKINENARMSTEAISRNPAASCWGEDSDRQRRKPPPTDDGPLPKRWPSVSMAALSISARSDTHVGRLRVRAGIVVLTPILLAGFH